MSKFTNELNKLVLENPTARVKFNVSEDTSFYEHSCLLIDEENAVVNLEELCLVDDKYYDLEELTDKVNDEIWDDHNDLNDREYEEYLENHIEANYEFEKIIVVRLGD